MMLPPGPVRSSSPAWTVWLDNATNVLLEADLHSTGGTTEETRRTPCAKRPVGMSNNAKTIRTFLIYPLLQVRQVYREFWSALANRCGENPELPVINRTRCQGQAADEPYGMHAICRKFASFVRARRASETHRANEPFFRGSFQHSQRMSRSPAGHSLGSFPRSFFL